MAVFCNKKERFGSSKILLFYVVTTYKRFGLIYLDEACAWSLFPSLAAWQMNLCLMLKKSLTKQNKTNLLLFFSLGLTRTTEKASQVLLARAAL